MTAAEGEDCRRCGGPNFVWFAPSPLWNLVMRGNDINGPIKFGDLVCAGCFMELAVAVGAEGKWRLTLDPEPDGLIYATPSGRTWNPETWLWETPERPCASDGGVSVPGSHRCSCMMSPAHEGRHGCRCGAMWGCFDCPEADEVEGCAACGAVSAV